MTNIDTLVVYAQMKFAAISTIDETRSWVRVENLNLILNITAKFIANPMIDAYPAINISSCISAVVPTISVAAARYNPSEN